jgi:hypothetical protein
MKEKMFRNVTVDSSYYSHLNNLLLKRGRYQKKHVGSFKSVLIISLLMVLSLCLQFVVADQYFTSSLSPSSLDLCGAFPNNGTLIANNIQNIANINLFDVQARLVTPVNSGIIFLSNQTINLGDVASGSVPTIIPSWSIQCNQNNVGNHLVYLELSSGNYTSSLNGSSYSDVVVNPIVDNTPPSVLNNFPK